MRRTMMAALLVAVAVVVQLTMLNGLRLPGGGVPDLVLVVVAALGLAGGPAPGAVTGFAAGLCLDLAPPGSGVAGEYALVFCIVGWACGRLHGTLARSALLPMVTAAAAAALGEVAVAALGLALQPAQVSWASVRQVLPATVFYDIAISPFVLYLVLLATARLQGDASSRAAASAGLARLRRTSRTQAAGTAPPGRPGLAGLTGAAGPGGGAVLLGLGGWLAGPPRSRRERRAAARSSLRLRGGRSGDGWIGSSAARRTQFGQVRGSQPVGQGLGGSQGSRSHGAAVARLRSGVAGSATAHVPRTLAARPVHLRLASGRKRDGVLSRLRAGGARAGLGRRRPGRGGFRPSAMPGGSALARPARVSQRTASAPVRFGSRSSGPGHAPAVRLSPAGSGSGSGWLRRARRRDGVVGGGVVGGGALAAAGRAGTRVASPRFRIHATSPAAQRARPATPARLRMRSRRGDGRLGGSPASAGGGWGAARSRPATPRFRASPLAGARPVSGKRPRFARRRWPALTRLTGRRDRWPRPWRGRRRRAGGAPWSRPGAGPAPADGGSAVIPASRRRLAVVYVVLGALLLGLGARAWFLQVTTRSRYVAQANQDRIRDIVQPPVRGEIVDDNGSALVSNRSALVVSVNMSRVAQQRDGGAAELRRLAALLRMSDQALRDKVRLCTAGVSQPCWPGSPYQPIPVAEHVSDRVAVQVLESKREFPGVTAQVQPVTHYAQPIGTDAAQVLGYLQPITAQEVKHLGIPVTGFSGVDLVGQSGLEQQYDKELRGRAGADEVSVNAGGQVTGTIRRVTAEPGDDLVTSINAGLQADVENDLAAAIHKTQAEGNVKARTGAAVVMTTTGQIVAMASYPTYNPAVWTGGISNSEFRRLFGSADAEPVLNRATQGQYAPGSTWKVTSTAAAVSAGYSLYGDYNCPATTSIDGRSYANDGAPNLGPMSLRQALIVSCDTVYYDLAYDIWQHDHVAADDVTSPRAPVQEMQKMELAWGFGKDPGVDLPGQNPGSVPTREWLYYYWKDNAHRGQNWCKHGNPSGSYVQQIEYDDCKSGNVWTPGQAVIAAIGQGYVTVSPLQLADAYAALANGGTLYQPRLGEALLSPDGKVARRIRPRVVGRLPVAKSTLAYIRSALAGVVTQGTAASAFGGFPLSKVCVAGKTGTAQVTGNLATSVFASFAPCSHPRYVVVMMIPDSGYGADVSAPAVRQIWDSIYGLEGRRAALTGGALPGLPRINQAGQIVPATGAGAGRAGRHGKKRHS